MAMENTYTPNNTETLGTKYQRIDSNFREVSADKQSININSGQTAVLFNQNIGTAIYMVNRECFDNNDNIVEVKILNRTASGFTVDCDFNNVTMMFSITKIG